MPESKERDCNAYIIYILSLFVVLYFIGHKRLVAIVFGAVGILILHWHLPPERFVDIVASEATRNIPQRRWEKEKWLF